MATITKPKSKKAAPTVRVTLSTFDGAMGRPVYRAVRKGVKLKDFKAITSKDYSPAGNTPLIDAMVDFIEDIRGRGQKGEVQIGLLMDESGSMHGNAVAAISSANKFVDGLREVAAVDPKTSGKGFIVVLTDGYENASTRHTFEDVTSLLKKCEKDKWVVLFLGAGIDGWAQGRQVGVSGKSAFAQTVSTENSPAGTMAAVMDASHNAMHYLGDNAAYQVKARGMSSRSVSADGQVHANVNINANPSIVVPSPASLTGVTFGKFNPQDAISNATAALNDDDDAA